MYFKEEDTPVIYEYSDNDITFVTEDKKFALYAYKYILKLEEKKLKNETNESIKLCGKIISELSK